MTTGIRRIAVTAAGLDYVYEPSGRAEAELVIVSVAEPPPSPGQARALAAQLRARNLISIGVAAGTVTAEAALVLVSCDFLVAATDAVWDSAFADEAVVAELALRLPPSRLDELRLAPRPVGGDATVQLGLVLMVADDPTSAAEALGEELAPFDPGALASAKEMVDAALTGELGDALRLESRLQIDRLLSPAHQAVVAGWAAPPGSPQT